MPSRQYNRAAFDTDLSFGGSVSLYEPAAKVIKAPETVSQRYIREAKERFESRAAEIEAKVMAPRRVAAARFTTDYAIRYGRDQGWLLVDRERYDYRTKRHFDLEGGVDAIFDDRVSGRVGIQGAGKSERAEHFERFMSWGGPEKAKRRNLRILYLEFVRGDYAPTKLEWWA